MMWDQWGRGYGMDWGWFGAMHLLWWLLLIAGAAALLRYILGLKGGADRGEDRAHAVLRERYARGEIDQQEFDERMRHLKS